MATRKFAPCFTAITFSIDSEAVGLARKTNATIPRTMATPARPMRMGTMGGSVQRALSISSVMDTWPIPRSLCGGVDGGGGGKGKAGSGLISSGMVAPEPEYSSEMRKLTRKVTSYIQQHHFLPVIATAALPEKTYGQQELVDIVGDMDRLDAWTVFPKMA